MVLNKSSGTTFKRVVMFFMAIFVLSMVLVGCKSKIDSITLSKADLIISIGETEKITATVLPSDTKEKITWTSEAPAVATVSADGLVTGAGIGKTVITAKIGKVEAKLNVTVAAQYTVTFNTDGGSTAPAQTVTGGEKASKPEDPTKLGSIFVGWFKEAAGTNEFSFDNAIEANTTVYAKWTKKQYDVVLNVNGGVALETLKINHGDKITAPVATKAGYDFLGWYTDEKLATQFNFNTSITKELALYAKWEASTLIVSFNSNGGSAVTEVSLAYLEKVSAPTAPTKGGYVFAAWYSDEALTVEYNFDAEVTGSTTLYAKWTPTKSTITFDSKGGSEVVAVEIDTLTVMTEPGDPTRTSYLFAGWFTDAALTNAFDFNAPVQGPQTLYAKWDIDPNSTIKVLNFELNGGMFDITSTQPFLGDADPTSTQVLKQYNGGYNANAGTSIFLMKKNTAGHYALKVGLNRNANGFFEVTGIIPGAASTPDVTMYEYILAAHDSYAVGYAWLNTLEIGQIITVTGFDIATVPAGTTAVNGMINVYPAGTGKSATTGAFTIGDDFIQPVKAGYKFAGWYDNATFTGSPVAKVTAEGTLYAKFVIERAVTFEVNGGSAVANTIVPDGEKLAQPVDPTKAGHVFDGWYTDVELTTLFDFNAAVKADVKLYAKWVIILIADTDYKAVWNETLGTWFIEVKVPGEALDESAIKSITNTKVAGQVLETPVVLTPNTDSQMWFGVAKIDSELSLKKAGIYEYKIVRQDDTYYTFTFDYKPNLVTELSPIKVADVDQNAVWNVELNKWVIELSVAGEALDETAVKQIRLVKTVGNILETPEVITLGANTTLLFDVANDQKDLTFKAAGIYAYEVVRQDYSKFIVTFNYNPERVMGVREGIEVAEVDYKAVWNETLSTWEIEVVVSGKALDESAVKGITLVRKAGVDLETPEVITPNTDTTLKFGVAKADGDFAHMLIGRYTYKVVNTDDTEYQFEFFYDPAFVTDITQTVTHNVNGGSEVAKVVLEKGTKVAKPVDPTKKGYTFDGWFTDAEFKNAYDFEAPVTTNLTLNAKWNLNSYALTYNYNGGKMQYSNKTEMVEGFLKAFYDFVQPEEDLVTFMHGVDKTTGYDGTWHSLHSAKIYDGSRPTAVNDTKNLFIYSSEYQAKWLPFFDTIDEFIKVVNPIQFFFGAGTSVGLIRIRQFVMNVKPAAFVTDAQMNMMPGAFVAPATYNVNTATFSLPNPIREGFVFAGWYLNEEFTGEVVTTVSKGSTEDIVLYAKWNELFDLSFVTDGGTAVASQVTQETKLATQPVDPTKQGYYFGGWYVDADLSEVYDFNAPITGDLVLYAKWVANMVADVDYAALWNADLATWFIKVTVPGEALDESSIKSIAAIKVAGKAVEKPVALNPDLETVLWFGVAKADSDLTLKEAGVYVYEVVRQDNTKYSFAFNYKPQAVTGLDDVDVAEVDYKAVFNTERSTWYIEVTATEALDESVIKSFTDIRIAGEYVTPVVHEVNADTTFWFSVANETGSLGLKDSGVYSYLVTRQDDTKYILTFNYDRALVEGMPAVINAEVDYKAVWNSELGTWFIQVTVPAEALDESSVKEIVTVQKADVYIANEPLTPNTDTVLWFGVALANGDLAHKGAGQYTFAVLRQDDTRYLFSFDYDLELVENVTHKVTFNVAGGSEVTEQVVLKKALATKPETDPTKSGYTFVGWFKDSAFKNAFDFAAPIVADTIVYAKWTLDTYKVKYNFDGGKLVYANRDEALVDFLTDFYEFVKPTETLVEFMHGVGNTSGFNGLWYSNGTYRAKLYAANAKNVDASKPLFIQQPVYNAKWVAYFDYIDALVKEVNPAQGFWYSVYTGMLRFKAYATKASFFTPEQFDRIPNTRVATPSYNVHNNTFTLPNPVKEGFEFGGWFTNAEFTGEPVTTIVKGSTGDVEVFAKWNVPVVEHTVTFNVDGGSEVVAQEVLEGAKAVLPVDPTKEGFVFGGWFTEATFTTEYDFNTVVNAPIALYAKWEAEPAVLYESGFESTEGFAATTAYNQPAKDFGSVDNQWSIYFGTVSTTSPLSGLQSIQMRWYSTTPDNFGYAKTNFTVANVKTIEFNASSTGENSVKVSYSTDGINWVEEQTFTLGSDSASYAYEVKTSEAVYVKFDYILATPSVNKSRVCIDNVKFLG